MNFVWRRQLSCMAGLKVPGESPPTRKQLQNGLTSE